MGGKRGVQAKRSMNEVELGILALTRKKKKLLVHDKKKSHMYITLPGSTPAKLVGIDHMTPKYQDTPFSKGA